MLIQLHKRFVRSICAVSFFILLVVVLSSYKSFVKEIESDFKKIEYSILPSSNLTVNGKTNINSFSCISNEQFANERIDYRKDDNDLSISLRNTLFLLKVEELDCGKKKINKDLKKALQVENYPNIKILLKELINVECNEKIECNEWLSYDAQTEITITCNTRTIDIPIMVNRLDEMSYRVTGGTDLQLCDFDVEAPTALFGMIKVKDLIQFNFDLYVDLHDI